MSGDFTNRVEPIGLFSEWLKDAKASEPNDRTPWRSPPSMPTACPTSAWSCSRASTTGFVFYTNFESAKGRELLVNPQGRAVLPLEILRRQVRVRGTGEPVSDAEADAYFATRARGSRIGAWASKQSRPLESRFALEKAVAD